MLGELPLNHSLRQAGIYFALEQSQYVTVPNKDISHRTLLWMIDKLSKLLRSVIDVVMESLIPDEVCKEQSAGVQGSIIQNQ